jgi:hypothetical protein
LNLASDQIRDFGACAFAEALKSNNSLQRLDLNRNQIADTSACAMGQSLQSNSSLRQLDLQHNKIADAGACALGKALKSNCSLQQLVLHGNKISIPSVCIFMSRALHHSSLTEVSFGHTPLSCLRSSSWHRERLSNLPFALAHQKYEDAWWPGGVLCFLRSKLRFTISLVSRAAASCPIFGPCSYQLLQVVSPMIAHAQGLPVHASHRQWFRSSQCLRLLCICCPVSAVVVRLASTVGCKVITSLENRIMVCILKRCYCNFAWRLWIENLE